MFKLRDYQQTCLEQTVKARSRGVTKQLVAIATGGGKTEIFSRLSQYHDDIYPMLVLAHREELLTQAQAKLQRADPSLTVEIEMGAQMASTDADVVCASVATIGRNGSPRIERFAPDYFKTIVVDEAHHAAASTYKNVLRYFSSAFLIGFTATPKRADNVQLDDVFDEIVFEKNMMDLIREGYLSQPIPYRFTSDVDISTVKVSNGDYAIGELSSAVNIDARHEVCLEAYKKVREESGFDPSTVVFCVDVAHAEDLAKYFTEKGFEAKAVSGKTTNREEIIDAHKRGDFKILTNCMVAVEGYDDPNINAVIMARPTKSGIYYTQAAGRGARLDGRDNKFWLIDIVDASKGRRPISILSLMGLPSDFAADGVPLEETVEAYEKLKQKSPSQAATVSSLEDIGAAWEKIDLFTPPPVNEALLEYSRLLWMEVGEEYVINIGAEDRVTIFCDQMGLYNVKLNEELKGRGPSRANAFGYADSLVKELFPESIKLLDTQAPWRSDPPTDKQIKHLKKFHVPYEHLSKGEASQILDKLFKDNPRPGRPAWLDAKIAAEKRNKQGPF